MPTPTPPNYEVAFVSSVPDADGINAIASGRQIRIRLNHIDAPEDGQPFASPARQFLSSLVIETYILFHTIKIDRYGRHVADVLTHDGLDVSLLMLQHGFAWWYRVYSRSRQHRDAQTFARLHRKRLWSDPNPEPPWNYRNRMKGIKQKPDRGKEYEQA